MLTLEALLFVTVVIILLEIIYWFLNNARHRAAEKHFESKRDYRAERRAVHRRQIKEWDEAFGKPDTSYETPPSSPYHISLADHINRGERKWWYQDDRKK